MKQLTFLTLLLALLLTACNGTPTPTATPLVEPVETASTVIAEGKLLPAPAIELSFAQGGLIAEVLAQPGQQVAAGSVIARLVGSETVLAELAAAQLEQTLAQQTLDALQRNALLTATQAEKALLDAQKAYDDQAKNWKLGDEFATDLELSIEDYVLAEKDYQEARQLLNGLLDQEESNRERRDAQDDLDAESESLAAAYADLLAAVAENDQPLDEEQAALLLAIANLESARDTLERLGEDNLDAEKVAAAEARRKAAEAHITAAQAALATYELRAPFAATLLKLDLEVGETAIPGAPVAFLADVSQWTVETKDLAEIDIARVAIGQVVTIQLDAFPGETFTGEVTAIEPVGRDYLGDMTYPVTITLDEADERFLWNMTATVMINTD